MTSASNMACKTGWMMAAACFVIALLSQVAIADDKTTAEETLKGKGLIKTEQPTFSKPTPSFPRA